MMCRHDVTLDECTNTHLLEIMSASTKTAFPFLVRSNLCPIFLDLQGRRSECWEDRPDHCHCRDGWFLDLWRLVGQN